MSKATTDLIDGYAATEKRRRDKLSSAKAALLDALRHTRAAVVEITYDGEGDEGQIGDIRAISASNRPVKLSGSVVLDLDQAPHTYESLDGALDAFAWELLRSYHDGFENNGGGYGTIDIDVRKGKISIDHNDRIIEVSNTLTEV
jgi:hypothetical protein